MNKSKKLTALERATVALMVFCCAQPATAGNKAQVAPNGFGKVEASVTYGTAVTEAKVPPAGVLSTFSVFIPAAGDNPQASPYGFPSAGNIATVGLPSGSPSTVFSTTTSQLVTGGYKATTRGYVTAGATTGNPELELKIPIIPAECEASYNADSDIVEFTPTSGELRLTGNGSAGMAIWLRALLYTGTVVDPNEQELIDHSILKGELVVAGPFDYPVTCPARVPISGDMTKIYLLVDSAAKSEPYTLTCQNPVSVSCSDGDPQYPLPTLSGGCEAAEATVRYSVAPNDLPIGVPTQVTATAKAVLDNGSVDENSVLATCTFTATRTGLVFDGFYAPLSTAGTDCSKNFKKSELTSVGQVIPIKFKTLCGGISVGGTPPTYKIFTCPRGPTPVKEGTFIFVSNEWHAQFDTGEAGITVGKYVIEVKLQDGSTKTVAVQLK